ncbi:phage tail terminator family protein [Clostridium neonatale]|uniref:phage tail terminator family protein n=1 Tax=Clostridium neonatale TaxID=137838 RepID=UPI00291C20C4|nr:putative phage protein [Clostridium neonatale]CAI3569404.1 putative phage protein [Clostridium neonatale]
MLNKIITGISQKLDEEFNTEENEGYIIHTENVEQGLEEPCFFIFSLKPSSKQLVGNRYERKYPFDIHFFPDTELVDGISTINNQINEVTERLFTALEYITVDNSLVRGTSINAEIVDNVLHFFINFNMIVKKETEPIDTMGSLTIKQKLGGD